MVGRHRRARFFNLWSGKLLRPARFRRQLREDLGHVLGLLAAGKLQPQIARQLPLEQAGQALRLAESGEVTGKVVLLPAAA